MTLLPACLTSKADGLTLAVRVQPGAKSSEVCGIVGQELKVKIASPPVDGAANDALIKFVAGLLKTRPARVSLIQGQRSRSKVLKIEGVTAAQAAQFLLPYLEE